MDHFYLPGGGVVTDLITGRHLRDFSKVIGNQFLKIVRITPFRCVELLDGLIELCQINLLYRVFLRLTNDTEVIRHHGDRVPVGEVSGGVIRGRLAG